MKIEGRIISDHAILRYMERVLHINVDAIELLMRRTMEQSLDLGDGFLLGPDGEFYVEGYLGSIKTVLTAEQGRMSRRRQNRAAGRASA